MVERELYEFGEFTLDVAERSLSRGGAAVHLAPKAHDVLVALVRHSGRLVLKSELLTLVWPGAFVEEGILAVHVSNLRKALGDANRQPTFIETVSRSGYRFIAAVRKPASNEPSPSRKPLRPPEAYELVGRGRSHLLSASYFELPQAVSAFQSAIDIDATYAAAHAGLALARCAQASLRAVPPGEAYADAKAAALRALAMDDKCADAQVALGAVLYLSEWDWLGAERSLQRALEISPHHTEAYLHYGSLLEALGQLDRGLTMKRQALARDPFSPLVLVQIATSYWHQRRYDAVIEWASKALALDPRNPLAREFLAGAHLQKGDVDAFITENVRQAESFGAPPETIARISTMHDRLKVAYAEGGPQALARCTLAQMLEHQREGEGGTAIQLVLLHATAGDLDAAFRHLDRALASHDPSLVHLAVAPQWDALRGDPRLGRVLARMGLGPERLVPEPHATI